MPNGLTLIKIINGMAILQSCFEYRISISLRINSKIIKKDTCLKEIVWNVHEVEILIQPITKNKHYFHKEPKSIVNLEQLDTLKNILNKQLLERLIIYYIEKKITIQVCILGKIHY